jgi:hypothetical protein
LPLANSSLSSKPVEDLHLRELHHAWRTKNGRPGGSGLPKEVMLLNDNDAYLTIADRFL